MYQVNGQGGFQVPHFLEQVIITDGSPQIPVPISTGGVLCRRGLAQVRIKRFPAYV
jgi:hypothetical protein